MGFLYDEQSLKSFVNGGILGTWQADNIDTYACMYVFMHCKYVWPSTSMYIFKEHTCILDTKIAHVSGQRRTRASRPITSMNVNGLYKQKHASDLRNYGG
jgi:hypothetical protein